MVIEVTINDEIIWNKVIHCNGKCLLFSWQMRPWIHFDSCTLKKPMASLVNHKIDWNGDNKLYMASTWKNSGPVLVPPYTYSQFSAKQKKHTRSPRLYRVIPKRVPRASRHAMASLWDPIPAFERATLIDGLILANTRQSLGESADTLPKIYTTALQKRTKE